MSALPAVHPLKKQVELQTSYFYKFHWGNLWAERSNKHSCNTRLLALSVSVSFSNTNYIHRCFKSFIITHSALGNRRRTFRKMSVPGIYGCWKHYKYKFCLFVCFSLLARTEISLNSTKVFMNIRFSTLISYLKMALRLNVNRHPLTASYVFNFTRKFPMNCDRIQTFRRRLTSEVFLLLSAEFFPNVQYSMLTDMDFSRKQTLPK